MKDFWIYSLPKNVGKISDKQVQHKKKKKLYTPKVCFVSRLNINKKNKKKGEEERKSNLPLLYFSHQKKKKIKKKDNWLENYTKNYIYILK